MNRSLAFKLGTIALLIVLLLIPLQMIGSLITERQQQRNQVLQDIARSSSYQQRLTGPLLAVPYRKLVREWKTREPGAERYYEDRMESGTLYFLPEHFAVNGEIRTELRQRGIYQARLYHAATKIGGHFNLPAQLGLGADFATYHFEQPFLAVGISDIRGIENSLRLRINDESIHFAPGSRSAILGDGVHAMLPVQLSADALRVDFAFDLNLQGSGQLDIVPVGRETHVELRSDWPHPSFVGNYLPFAREIGSDGFLAKWQTTFFSTNMHEILQECTRKSRCDEFANRSFGVSFVDPVDQYLKSDRAIKYALLFVALTFAGFFLFEVLKRLAVHPIQYGLVGMALALFYLLLLSLSEHIGFALAYAVSSSACVLLIGFYVGTILRSFARGSGFALALAALYGFLYSLLSAEDYALLMGSILLFGLLGVVMIVTRKVDWFSLGSSKTQPSAN